MRSAACLFSLFLVGTLAAGPSRDLLIRGARVFGAPGADALVVSGNRIEAVGQAAALRPQAGRQPLELDARGGWVVPGFHDAHAHLLISGLAMGQADLNGCETVEQVLAAVESWATTHPEAAWVQGSGWRYGLVESGSFPTRQMLDTVGGGRPVVLDSYDGHAAWANTRALELAGIGPATQDPRGGRIVREADGETPAGTLLEGAAGLLGDVLPEPTRAEKLRALEAACAHFLDLGLTAAQDIESDPETLGLFAELEAAGRLPIRVSVSLPLDEDDVDLDHYEELRARYASPFLRLGWLKGFVDGVIESRTAVMVEPYAGSEVHGTPQMSREVLIGRVLAAHRRGFQVALHACGDGGVRLALDAYAAAEREMPGKSLRHRVEHVEVVHPRDRSRFGRLGVIASLQPRHATPVSGDPDADDPWVANVGPGRIRHTFPWRELWDAGARLAFGSDWSVMSADPLQALAVAISRRNEKGEPEEGWNAHQCLSAGEAVAAYTSGSAYAIHRERELGRLAAGYLADLVVLEPGVELEDPATLWAGKRIRAVVVDGRVVRGDAVPVPGR